MTISVGEKLPDATFKTTADSGPKEVTTHDVFAGKKVVFFGVPGAFTPTCSNNHLPGFLENRDAILSRGVDTIAVVAVNDQHVMKAWAEASGALGKIDFIADGNAELARALGLDKDFSGGGMGTRFARSAMIIRDGIADAVFIEDGRGVTTSGAPAILMALEAANS